MNAHVTYHKHTQKYRCWVIRLHDGELEGWAKYPSATFYYSMIEMSSLYYQPVNSPVFHPCQPQEGFQSHQANQCPPSVYPNKWKSFSVDTSSPFGFNDIWSLLFLSWRESHFLAPCEENQCISTFGCRSSGSSFLLQYPDALSGLPSCIILPDTTLDRRRWVRNAPLCAYAALLFHIVHIMRSYLKATFFLNVNAL